MRNRTLSSGRIVKSWLYAAAAALAVSLPRVTRGVDYTGSNTNFPNWSNPDGWTPTGVPQNGDNATLPFSCHFDYVYNAGGGLNNLRLDIYPGSSFCQLVQDLGNTRMFANQETISGPIEPATGLSTYTQSAGINSTAWLTLATGSGQRGSYTLSGTGTLIASRLDVGLAGGNGTFTQSGGYTSVQHGPDGYGLLIAPSGGSGGTLALSGGVLNTDAAYLGGYFLSGGTGFLNISGGQMTVNGQLLVYNTVGTQINLSGGILSVADLNMQGAPLFSVLNWTGGALGSLSPLNIASSGMFGANLPVTGNRRLFVGQLSDANTYPGTVFIGGSGIATLSSGGAVTTDGHLIVGIEGAGSFTQTGGTNSVGFDLLVGYGGDGYYSLSGGTVTTPGDETRLGSNGGNGTFDMSGGTLLTSQLNVGLDGNGTFTQTGGYANVQGPIHIGFSPSENGRLALNGASAVMNVAGAVNRVSVGVDGAGWLSVLGGASLSVDGTIVAGDNADGNGTILVSGGGSRLSSGVELLIGDNQNGRLTVDSGGLVTSNSIAAVASGTVTIDTGGVWNVNGSAYVGGDQSTPIGSGVVNLNNGSVTVSGTLKVWNNGTVFFNGGSLSAGSVVLSVGASGGGKLLLSTGRNKVLRVNGDCVVDDGCRIDLADNAMISERTPGGVTAVPSLVATGYNGGNWLGNGITSSSAAAAASSQHRTALGVALATDLFKSFPATFLGQNIDSLSVLVRYVYSGDANLDGTVNALDFNALATHFGGAGGSSWAQGDFNYDTIVNALDFTALGANFGSTLPPPAPAPEFGSLAPEPSGFIFLAGFWLLPRGRRACRQLLGHRGGTC
jgi:T5SS/PEP-CTERM-associated repeat protein